MRSPASICGNAAGSFRCQGLPARRLIEIEQRNQVVIDRTQPQRRVGEHRKEGNDPGASQYRQRLWEIDQQERRDGDDGRHLQNNRVRVKRVFDKA